MIAEYMTVIYTIGYQGLTPAQFIGLLKEHGVDLLLDVRSRPHSRMKGFAKNTVADSLEEAGIDYQWAGDRLGGFSGIGEPAIAGLVETEERKTVCLMCMEADPDKCHRKTEIARRLADYGVSAHHIVIAPEFM